MSEDVSAELYFQVAPTDNVDIQAKIHWLIANPLSNLLYDFLDAIIINIICGNHLEANSVVMFNVAITLHYQVNH